VTDVVVDTLRLRGEHARRLASVAARALPAALGRALADVPDVSLPSVHVILDLDVSQYDDATLAIMWADAIRAEVLAACSGAQPPPSAESQEVGGGGQARSFAAADVLRAARRRLAARGRRDTIVERPLLRLGEAETARAVASALGPEEWSRLLRSLAASLGPASSRRGRPAASAETPAAPPDSASPGHGRAPEQRSDPPSSSDGAAAVQEVPPDATPTTSPLDLLEALDDLLSAELATLDAATVTRVAGIVLLYPWLADHCRLAERLHPDLDPVDVREAALAVVVDPADAALADDVLIRLLAGRPALLPRAERVRAPLPHIDQLQTAAEGVLASFAAMLPGLESSSASFVRENWIARLGVLDLDRDPAMLTAATHPLDVVLPLLPYPVGLLKLPWSPAITVRFRP
jgi:hypothetical protein